MRDDPYRRFAFLVEIDGLTVAGFSEVSGLQAEVEVVEYRNGSEDTRVRKLPGLKKFSNIVLKRGVTGSTELWDWFQQVLDGNVTRRNGSIVLLDEAREERVRWNFREGWPCKWNGPRLQAENSEVAIESLEIAHEGIQMQGP